MMHDWQPHKVWWDEKCWKCQNCDSVVAKEVMPAPDTLIHPPLNLETGARSGAGVTCAEMIAKRVHDA